MGLEQFFFYFMMTKTLHMSNGNSTYQLIFTHKIISNYPWNNDSHTLQNGRKTVVTLHIYGDRANLLLFRFMNKTMNLSDVKYK